MDYPVVWAESALDDLRQLVRYIATDDPIAAERFGMTIIRKVEALPTFPRMGRMVPEIGAERIRELILAPCRIVYELDEMEDTISIIRLWQSARGEPEL